MDLLGAGSGTLDIRGQTASHPDNSVVLDTVIVPGLAGINSFTSVAVHLPVVAGELLAFVIYGGSGALFGSTRSGYSDGELWTFGNPPFGVDGSGTWYPNGAGPERIELAFATFVDVPEPGTFGSVASVFALLAHYLRRRRIQA